MRWMSFFLACCCGLGVARADVTVYAPGAMGDSLEEIAGLAATAGRPFKLVEGHSPGQARQIVDGAPADVFISADPQWMDFLADRHLLAAGSRAPLAATRLVLVAPAGSGLAASLRPGESLAAALGGGKLAIADPDMVPAGRFAKAALEKQGSWPDLAGHLAMLPHVRAVALTVERGEAVAGIGFLSELSNDPKIRIVGEFPSDLAPPIVFPLAVVAGHEGDAVTQVVEFLRGPQSQAVLRAHGFDAPQE